jgi:hypothetical protein
MDTTSDTEFTHQSWMAGGDFDYGCEVCRRYVWETSWGSYHTMEPFDFMGRAGGGWIHLYQCKSCGTFWKAVYDDRKADEAHPLPLEIARKEFPEVQLTPGRCEPYVIKKNIEIFLRRFFGNQMPSRFQWTNESVMHARGLTGAKELTTTLHENLKAILQGVCEAVPITRELSWPSKELKVNDPVTGVLYRLLICDFYPIAALRMEASNGTELIRHAADAEEKHERSRLLKLKYTILWLARRAMKEEGYCLLLSGDRAFTHSISITNKDFSHASDYLFGPGSW